MRAGRPALSSDAFEDAVRDHLSGRLTEAIAQYERLLAGDPSNAEVHRRLGVAKLQKGDAAGSERALLRAAELAPGSVQLMGDIGALRLAQGRYREAVGLLEEVLRRAPGHADALNHCGIAWMEMGRLEKAAPLFERLTRARPDWASSFRLLGDAQYKLGRHGEAIASLERALEIDADDRQARLALGDAYESLGRMREARAQYVALLRRHPDSPLALARLLMLGGADAQAEWAESAQALAGSATLPAEARARVAIALAHHHDRAGRYDEAFGWLERGNALLRERCPYDVRHFGEAVDRLMKVFTRAQVESMRSRYASASDKPLFIVGMPRSGTTLLEQMLAAHSRVEAGGELSTMLNVAARSKGLSVSGADYPHAVRDLDAAALRRLADFYLERLERISASAARVTDKLPFNFMHVGLIAALFPRAAIVHCRRDPLDTCVSCYFTSFSEQIRFASDQATLGAYYRHYERLMEHWRAVVPETLLDVRYEELVADTERRLREVLAHCGLEWEPGCLAFEDVARSIRTPSRWQVRRPVSAASVGRWKRYERWIEPLRRALAAR
jgi:tetratricopeptide (TPR) repeat protein